MASFATVTGKVDNETLIKRLVDDPEAPPSEYGGIRWWRVGRNASHDFYLGLDDQGQLWRSAFCADDCKLCDCPWDKSCRCETLDVAEVFTRNRRPVKDGDQLYLGR